jgi:hypothetical protein
MLVSTRKMSTTLDMMRLMRATPLTISGNDDFTQAMGEGITQATTATLATSLVTTVAEGKKVSQRTESYTTGEDKLICSAWIEISQDPLCGAEQKGFAYWRRVGKYFNEHRLFPSSPFYSDRKDISLAKRWGFIHAECSKFQRSFETVKRRAISGVSTVDMVNLLPSSQCSLQTFWAYIIDCCPRV